MDALFISDVHVSPARPEAAHQLVALLAGPARATGAVYLLGDIFDQWLGDDDGSDVHLAVEAALAALSTSGRSVYMMHGNHDFLVGSDFVNRTGCQMLAEPAVIDLAGLRTVLMHGDVLCTDDVDYQKFRVYSRDPAVQQGFLALPMEARVARAAALRHETNELKQLKHDDIMDVNEGAVRATFQAHDADQLIHGHTHRPAIHERREGGRRQVRIVLGDWYQTGRVGVARDAGVELVPVTELLTS